MAVALFDRYQVFSSKYGMAKFNEEAHTKDTITVQDTTYDIRTLLRQAHRNSENINLRTGSRKRVTAKRIKYTLEDRVWQAQSTWQEIQARYKLTEIQARSMQWQARAALMKLDIDF